MSCSSYVQNNTYRTTPHHFIRYMILRYKIASRHKKINKIHSFILILIHLDFSVPLGSFATTDQGNMRGTSVLRFSEMDTSSGVDTETAKALYQKGSTLHVAFCLFEL